MPDPVSSTPTPATTLVAEPGPPPAAFAEQLRAAAPAATITVSLAAMVTAHAGGVSALAGTAPGASVGLGAMSGLGAIGNASAAGIVRARTGDEAKVDTVVRFALAQQGKPYVFGTRGPDTYDCSGLMTAAYKEVGIDMPAYTFTQATLGRAVDPATEPIKPGDMIFVRGGRPPTDLGHVGMAISATEWIQAPRTGDVVKVGPLPYDRIQVVRRMVG